MTEHEPVRNSVKFKYMVIGLVSYLLVCILSLAQGTSRQLHGAVHTFPSCITSTCVRLCAHSIDTAVEAHRDTLVAICFLIPFKTFTDIWLYTVPIETIIFAYWNTNNAVWIFILFSVTFQTGTHIRFSTVSIYTAF
jgi:hypothetical protein